MGVWLLVRSARAIAARFPESKAIWLVERCEELRQRHAERAGQAIDDLERGRLLAALEIADVCPVQPSAVSHGTDLFVHRFIYTTAFTGT
jgi:hypothetical protein